jgi:hypothetical protein
MGQATGVAESIEKQPGESRMAYTVSYRTCQPLSPDQEAAVRLAADSFNQGRSWVLSFRRDDRDGRLTCRMAPKDLPEGDPAAWNSLPWPGAYEAKCLLDGLCRISRDCSVDLEIHDPYGRRPIGIIRGGECIADEEARVEAMRNMAEVHRRKN